MNAPSLIETKLDWSLDSVVPNAMTFTQTDDQSWFILDPSQTFANPDPPKLNSTTVFNIGGLWINDTYVAAMNFKCHLFGELVYNESFPYEQDVSAGGWSY